MPTRSRTAFAYSARFNLCTSGRPGFGARLASSSLMAARWDTSSARAGFSGLGASAGGITPARASLRARFFAQRGPSRRPLLDADALEHAPAALDAFVVAGHTVLIDDGARGYSGARRLTARWRGGEGGARVGERHGERQETL